MCLTKKYIERVMSGEKLRLGEFISEYTTTWYTNYTTSSGTPVTWTYTSNNTTHTGTFTSASVPLEWGSGSQ